MQINSFSYGWLSTKPRFEKEANWPITIAYRPLQKGIQHLRTKYSLFADYFSYFFSAFSYIALQARELFFIKLKFYLQPSTNLSTIQYNKKKKIKLTTILYFPLIRLGFKYSTTKISSHKVLHFLSEM